MSKKYILISYSSKKKSNIEKDTNLDFQGPLSPHRYPLICLHLARTSNR